MTWHWIGLAFFSITLFPAGLAMVTGQAPKRLRPRLASTPPHGWTILALYAAALLHAIARLAGASPMITLAATATAGVIGCAVAAIASHRTAGAAS